MTSSAEVLDPQHLHHSLRYPRYTRACLYVDKGSAVAGVASCLPNSVQAQAGAFLELRAGADVIVEEKLLAEAGARQHIRESPVFF